MSHPTDDVRFHGPGFRSPDPRDLAVGERVVGPAPPTTTSTTSEPDDGAPTPTPSSPTPSSPTPSSPTPSHVRTVADRELMRLAIDMASQVRGTTSTNPPVGAAIQLDDGSCHLGATQPIGGAHAEIMAMRAASSTGGDLAGATVASTLEPCDHTGRTGPCTEALIEAGVARVVIAIEDPDPLVAGRGAARLADAGIEVITGVECAAVETQLAAYLTHRRTGRPLVVLKLASTLDGGTAAPDRTSQWITGEAARHNAHRLRGESDAILVGAGTVRDDDPSLTVRIDPTDPLSGKEPLRVVLGNAPPDAKVHPCLERSGDLGPILDELGERGVMQLMVEGGAGVAAAFHRAGLVDHYVLYLAPALFGGHDHRGLFAGAGAPSMSDLWRGRILATTQLGGDLRIDLAPVRQDTVISQLEEDAHVHRDR